MLSVDSDHTHLSIVSVQLWSFKFGGPKLVNIYALITRYLNDSFELFKEILLAWDSCLFIKYFYFGQKIVKTNFDLQSGNSVT